MEDFEHYALTSFSSPPLIWICYVEDTFCILNPDFFLTFPDHLSSICSSISFTLEKEIFNSFSFLDGTVYQNQNNTLQLLFIRNPLIEINIYNSPLTTLDFKNSLFLVLCIIELTHNTHVSNKTNKNHVT